MKVDIKLFKLVCSIALFVLLLYSCAKDNYDAPSSRLTGRIVYNDNAIGVKASGGTEASAGTVKLEIWQGQFGKETPMDVNISQDGSFSSLIYDGKCRLVAKDGIGPWENKHDTIMFEMKGGLKIDYPVVPYFTISNVRYELKDSLLTAKYTVTKVSEKANVASTGLVINKTIFVDLDVNVNVSSIAGTTGDVSITMDLKKYLKEERHLYARVFVKNSGVDEAVYSTESYLIK